MYVDTYCILQPWPGACLAYLWRRDMTERLWTTVLSQSWSCGSAHAAAQGTRAPWPVPPGWYCHQYTTQITITSANNSTAEGATTDSRDRSRYSPCNFSVLPQHTCHPVARTLVRVTYTTHRPFIHRNSLKCHRLSNFCHHRKETDDRGRAEKNVWRHYFHRTYNILFFCCSTQCITKPCSNSTA